ncbi:LexA family protein [Bacillus infantis]|uniref:LexA family protein n=1 Tax=Bacillus infantis TaxID=324767 RepID=UPI003CE8D336
MRETKKKILTFIAAYIEEHGYSPTYREIMEGVGLYSSSTVSRHVTDLREKGYITFEEARPRTIRIMKV